MKSSTNTDRHFTSNTANKQTKVQYIKFKGYQIAVQVTGQGAPLLLLHGTPAYSYIWRKMVSELANHFCVYTYDMLGYGDSDAAWNDEVHLDIQTQLCATVIEHFNLHKPLVAAHDFGGAVALRVHLLQHIDFRKLLLMDAVCLPNWGTPFAHLVREHHYVFKQIPEYMAESMIRAYIETAMHQPIQNVVDHYMKPWQGEERRMAFFNQIAQFDQKYTDEFLPLISTIHMPVRILWGREDQWLPPEHAIRLAEQIPGATYRWIENAGHFIQEDQPAQVIQEMRNFFMTESLE